MHKRAVAIGVFDGVHRGHQALLKKAETLANQYGLVPSALTFNPHPAQVLKPDMAPPLLESLSTRKKHLREYGANKVFVLDFDPQVAQLSPEDFVEQILVSRTQAAAVVVGEGFVFGNQRSGSFEDLKTLGQKHGFQAHQVPGVHLEGGRVSSTRVRGFVQAGQMPAAAELLGRPFALFGPVVRGAERGRSIGIPTANLSPDADVQPAIGVYISECVLRDSNEDNHTGQVYPSVTNVGFHPTFKHQGLKVETHMLDYHGPDIYGQEIEVRFVQRLRDERRFDQVEDLIAQIHRDIQDAREVHQQRAT